MVDGALVNPVPISLCRAMGASVVIAVNLSGGVPALPKLAYPNLSGNSDLALAMPKTEFPLKPEERIGKKAGLLSNLLLRRKSLAPTLLESMSAALDIMQDRITRSRLAGDPPDVMISPRVGHVGVLEFDRADELVTIGKSSTLAMRPAIDMAMEGA